MLLSPTWPGFVRGTSEVQNKTLAQVKEPGLRVYVVYLPILRTDAEESVPPTATRLPDQRVSFFWDGKGELATVERRAVFVLISAGLSIPLAFLSRAVPYLAIAGGILAAGALLWFFQRRCSSCPWRNRSRPMDQNSR